MANTYTNILIHVVFSTKNREKWLNPDVRLKLFPYFGGIARKNDMKLLCAGGVSDHVHLLLSLVPKLSVSIAVQYIKGGSSHWIHETFPELKIFTWQHGYGAFSIGVSQIERTKEYIYNQEEHHKRLTFRDEYLAFLKKNETEFDKQYVLG